MAKRFGPVYEAAMFTIPAGIELTPTPVDWPRSTYMPITVRGKRLIGFRDLRGYLRKDLGPWIVLWHNRAYRLTDDQAATFRHQEGVQ
jgi:hypothetical protein